MYHGDDDEGNDDIQCHYCLHNCEPRLQSLGDACFHCNHCSTHCLRNIVIHFELIHCLFIQILM